MGENKKEQDIAICKNCKHFRHLTEPDKYFGTGYICMYHGKMVPWRTNNPHKAADTEEEFERSHIIFAGRDDDQCVQHPERCWPKKQQ